MYSNTLLIRSLGFSYPNYLEELLNQYKDDKEKPNVPGFWELCGYYFPFEGKKKNNITKKYSVGSKDRKNERGIVEKNTEEIRWKGKKVMFKTEADTTSGISRQR